MFPTHLFLLPVKVDGPGRYLTRGGETVVVDEVVEPGVLTARYGGRHPCGTRDVWYSCGRVLPSLESPHDILSKA